MERFQLLFDELTRTVVLVVRWFLLKGAASIALLRAKLRFIYIYVQIADARLVAV